MRKIVFTFKYNFNFDKPDFNSELFKEISEDQKKEMLEAIETNEKKKYVNLFQIDFDLIHGLKETDIISEVIKLKTRLLNNKSYSDCKLYSLFNECLKEYPKVSESKKNIELINCDYYSL